jgi:hypothetical protein
MPGFVAVDQFDPERVEPVPEPQVLYPERLLFLDKRQFPEPSWKS